MRSSHVISRFAPCLTLVLAMGMTLAAPPGGPEIPDNRHMDFLAWEEGDWDARIAMTDPAGGPDQLFTAEQEDRFGGCGLWLITDLRMVSAKAGVEPPPYQGHGVLGYDPAREKLVGVWVDSRTNWLAAAEGQVDPDGKRLVLDVEGRNPMSGEPMALRYVTTRIDEDTRRLEVFVPMGDGGQFKVATIDYTRRQRQAAR